MKIKWGRRKGKRVCRDDGSWWVREEGDGEKVHTLNRREEGEKESGIYFHLSTAFKAINTYKSYCFGALGQYWSCCVFVCDGWFFTFMLFVIRVLTMSEPRLSLILLEKSWTHDYQFTGCHCYTGAKSNFVEANMGILPQTAGGHEIRIKALI